MRITANYTIGCTRSCISHLCYQYQKLRKFANAFEFACCLQETSEVHGKLIRVDEILVIRLLALGDVVVLF